MLGRLLARLSRRRAPRARHRAAAAAAAMACAPRPTAHRPTPPLRARRRALVRPVAAGPQLLVRAARRRREVASAGGGEGGGPRQRRHAGRGRHPLVPRRARPRADNARLCTGRGVGLGAGPPSLAASGAHEPWIRFRLSSPPSYRDARSGAGTWRAMASDEWRRATCGCLNGERATPRWWASRSRDVAALVVVRRRCGSAVPAGDMPRRRSDSCARIACSNGLESVYEDPCSGWRGSAPPSRHAPAPALRRTGCMRVHEVRVDWGRACARRRPSRLPPAVAVAVRAGPLISASPTLLDA